MITKELEKQAIEFMNVYWDTYLAGDVETWSEFISDDYKNIGGTDEEVSNSKHEVLNYTKSVIDRMVGAAELRNKRSEVSSLDPYILVHEFMDMYVKTSDEWSFYGKFRLSSILKQGTKGFQVVHQHGSYPDSKMVQAREAQIEAALERVRARTMAMQKSTELPEAANVLFLQVQSLGIPAWSCGYNILGEDGTSATCCMSSEGTLQTPFTLRLFGESSFAEMGSFMRSDETMLVQELGDKALKAHYDYMKSFPDLKGTFDQIDELGLSLPTYQVNHLCKFAQGFLLFITYEKVPGAHELFKRFTKVFEQTYTRFLDLQKAEIQAREAQIQLGLERVRARTMAMQKSEELKDVANEMRSQLGLLGQKELETCAIHLYEISPDYFESWAALRSPQSEAEIVHIQVQFPKKGVKIIEEAIKSYESGMKDYVLLNDEAKALEFFEMIKQYAPEAYGVVSESVKDKRVDDIFSYWSVSDFPGGSLIMTTLNEPDEHSRALLQKFSTVFGLAYRRFADLKKAEAQTRESQIQLALERVRARTMAMQHSTELAEVSSLLFEQMHSLGIHSYSSGFTIWDNDNNELVSWMCNADGSMNPPFIMPIDGNEWHMRQFESWKKGEGFIIHDFTGEEMQAHFKYLRSYPSLDEAFKRSIAAGHPMPERQVHNVANFSYGNLLFITLDPCPEAHDIFVRFSKVFDQTYTRFLDLQKAETQAREAHIEAALERVRSRTMAMQRSNELGAVATVLFEEMNRLVANLWTCGFVLCEKERSEDEWWLSMDTGFTRGFFLPNVGDLAHATLYEGWMKQEDFRAVQLDGDLLQEHYRWLMTMEVSRKIFEEMDAAGLERPTWQKLHAAYFSKGYLVLITREPCGEEEVFKRFAQVFDLTYTRFLDLQLAEAQAEQAQRNMIQIREEKLKAEIALTELKAAQTQLIQAEKMASLGELTAGIAHEIQNPLNFVNNFSEVSSELVDEMNEELDKGDLTEARAIASDIKQNLERIGHHGKRADSIVKGMLEHSRSSSGEKQPTDINKLADEFLRLAYHGVRAKDKGFNVTLKTEFDESIGLVNTVSQDIGRVLLNLINNAFYAVDEKRSSQRDELYEPTVSVSTKKVDHMVEIVVADNGNGIPEKIMDKIFQPFFTTKPTGQGTGLGLSLCYDIVKANGGEIRVSTTEWEGARFVMSIPDGSTL